MFPPKGSLQIKFLEKCPQKRDFVFVDGFPKNDAENIFHKICFKSWSVWFDQIDEVILESLMSFPIGELKPNPSIEVKTKVLIWISFEIFVH